MERCPICLDDFVHDKTTIMTCSRCKARVCDKCFQSSINLPSDSLPFWKCPLCRKMEIATLNFDVQKQTYHGVDPCEQFQMQCTKKRWNNVLGGSGFRK